MSAFDDAVSRISIEISRSLVNGDALTKALRQGARAAIDEQRAHGEVEAKLLLAVEENDRLKKERDQIAVERDALADDNARLRARGPA